MDVLLDLRSATKNGSLESGRPDRQVGGVRAFDFDRLEVLVVACSGLTGNCAGAALTGG